MLDTNGARLAIASAQVLLAIADVAAEGYGNWRHGVARLKPGPTYQLTSRASASAARRRRGRRRWCDGRGRLRTRGGLLEQPLRARATRPESRRASCGAGHASSRRREDATSRRTRSSYRASSSRMPRKSAGSTFLASSAPRALARVRAGWREHRAEFGERGLQPGEVRLFAVDDVLIGVVEVVVADNPGDSLRAAR